MTLYDIESGRCERLAARHPGSRIAKSIEEVLEANPDIVVEAASQEAVRQYGPLVLEKGLTLIVLSVGALLDDNTLKALM